MKTDLLPHLVCPECRTPLRLDEHQREQAEVMTGRLVCEHGHEYRVSKGVPRFVDADAYADSFSRQRLYVRRHFEHYRNDRSGDEQFGRTTSFNDEDLKTGFTLEVGCGYGRFVDVVQRRGGRIVGIDLSTHSIELAYDFVGRKPNVHLVQCDLFKLPFRPAFFDRIFSIGVLHHTPDTRRAFAALPPYLEPGGQISIWVYHPADKGTANAWRRVTTKMNQRVLYGFCVANQFLFSWIRRLPGGERFSYFIPGGRPKPGQSIWQRVLGDFDNLSPTYAHVHTEAEVVQWFRDAGLTGVRQLDRRSAVTGTRPR